MVFAALTSIVSVFTSNLLPTLHAGAVLTSDRWKKKSFLELFAWLLAVSMYNWIRTAVWKGLGGVWNENFTGSRTQFCLRAAFWARFWHALILCTPLAGALRGLARRPEKFPSRSCKSSGQCGTTSVLYGTIGSCACVVWPSSWGLGLSNLQKLVFLPWNLSVLAHLGWPLTNGCSKRCVTPILHVAHSMPVPLSLSYRVRFVTEIYWRLLGGTPYRKYILEKCGDVWVLLYTHGTLRSMVRYLGTCSLVKRTFGSTFTLRIFFKSRR